MSNQNSHLKLALFGVGTMGQTHLQNILKNREGMYQLNNIIN